MGPLPPSLLAIKVWFSRPKTIAATTSTPPPLILEISLKKNTSFFDALPKRFNPIFWHLGSKPDQSLLLILLSSSLPSLHAGLFKHIQELSSNLSLNLNQSQIIQVSIALANRPPNCPPTHIKSCLCFLKPEIISKPVEKIPYNRQPWDVRYHHRI